MNWGRRRHKYNAVRTEVDGIKFASKGEARRYQELKILESNGHISNLSLQPKFDFVVSGTKICRYVGDFQYQDSEGKWIVEDKKGFLTPEYKIKRALFCALYGDKFIHRES